MNHPSISWFIHSFNHWFSFIDPLISFIHVCSWACFSGNVGFLLVTNWRREACWWMRLAVECFIHPGTRSQAFIMRRTLYFCWLFPPPLSSSPLSSRSSSSSSQESAAQDFGSARQLWTTAIEFLGRSIRFSWNQADIWSCWYPIGAFKRSNMQVELFESYIIAVSFQAWISYLRNLMCWMGFSLARQRCTAGAFRFGRNLFSHDLVLMRTILLQYI